MSKNEYRICNIHAELLDGLRQGKGNVYYIQDIAEIRDKIKYKRYGENSELVQYITDCGINLKSYKDADAEYVDRYNTIAIRELINNINSWDMNCFVRDRFYLAIRLGVDQIKYSRDIYNLFKLSFSDLHQRAYFVQQVQREGRQPSLNDYLNTDYYIDACRSCAGQRWELFKQFGKEYGFRREQYIRMDYVFGMGDLYYDQFTDYIDYILTARQNMIAEVRRKYNADGTLKSK